MVYKKVSSYDLIACIMLSSPLGCGTGNYVAALSEHVGKVTGLDFNLGMLEQAKIKTATCSNVELLQGDATNLPFPNNSFDGAICSQVSSPELACTKIEF